MPHGHIPLQDYCSLTLGITFFFYYSYELIIYSWAWTIYLYILFYIVQKPINMEDGQVQTFGLRCEEAMGFMVSTNLYYLEPIPTSNLNVGWLHEETI